VQNCNNGFQITCRADLLGNPLLTGSGVDSPRWSVADFDWPGNTAKHATQPARFGNAGPNTLQGNGFTNFDLSVRKDIPVNERFRLEFRFESFNFTNTPAFGQPASTINQAGPATITSAGAPRNIQFALKFLF